MSLPEKEIERRKPVWVALSNLWLDTELTDDDLNYIAATMDKSGFSISELREIYEYEVAPVVYRNLLSVTGEWAGFDEACLHEEIIKLLRRRNRFTLLKYKMMKKPMLYATERHWNTLLGKMKRNDENEC